MWLVLLGTYVHSYWANGVGGMVSVWVCIVCKFLVHWVGLFVIEGEDYGCVVDVELGVVVIARVLC